MILDRKFRSLYLRRDGVTYRHGDKVRVYERDYHPIDNWKPGDPSTFSDVVEEGTVTVKVSTDQVSLMFVNASGWNRLLATFDRIEKVK